MVDWSSFLSYETVKIVRVHDKRLAIIHYLFLVGVICYITGYVIVFQQRYLLTGVPTGSVRLTLQAPRLRTPSDDLKYCLSPTQPTIPNTTYINFNCTYWDESFVVFPSVEDHDMFITTRVNVSDEFLPNNCSLDNETCDYISNSDPNVYYIPDIERFTMMFDHTVFVPGILAPMSALKLRGRLVDKNGKVVTLPQTPLNHVGLTGQPDILELGTLLKAGGIDLDSKAETVNKFGWNVTKRYDGIVVLVFLEYSNLNDVSWNLKNIEYTFRVTLVDGAKFSVTQPVYTKSLDKRQIWTRHGVRIVVEHTGSIGKFDFQTLLLSFVGGLGLLAVGTVVVDSLATKILPAKKVYEKLKYEDSRDIHHKLFDSEESESGRFDDANSNASDDKKPLRGSSKKRAESSAPFQSYDTFLAQGSKDLDPKV